MAGKDVGLGALGLDGTSAISGGLRFAQFQSTSGLAVYSDPDYVNPNVGNNLIGPKYFHQFQRQGAQQQGQAFSGIRPGAFMGCVDASGRQNADRADYRRLGLERRSPVRSAKIERLPPDSGQIDNRHWLTTSAILFTINTSHYTHAPLA